MKYFDRRKTNCTPTTRLPRALSRFLRPEKSIGATRLVTFPREIEARQNVSTKSNRLSFLSFSLLPLLDLDIRPCSPRIDNRHGARRAARYNFVYRGLTRPRGHLSNLPPRRDIGTVFSLNPRSIATVSQQVTPFAPGNSSIVLADCTLLFTRDKSFSSLRLSRLGGEIRGNLTRHLRSRTKEPGASRANGRKREENW